MEGITGMHPVKILRQLQKGVQGHFAYVSGKNNKDNLNVHNPIMISLRKCYATIINYTLADVLDGEKADV